MLLLEAQLVFNYIDDTDSLPHSVTPSLKGHLAISAMYTLYVDRFGRFLRFVN